MKIYLLSISVFIFLAACQKPDNAITGGGKGGNAVLSITPEHADSLISTMTIFIKYGVQDAPTNGLYDDSAKVSFINGTPQGIFKGLTRGLYYIYGVGTHPGYTPPGLKGGIPCSISGNNDSLHIFLPTYSF